MLRNTILLAIASVASGQSGQMPMDPMPVAFSESSTVNLWKHDYFSSDEFDSTNREDLDYEKWLPGFYGSDCTTDMIKADMCTPLWYGTLPVVITPNLAKMESGGMTLRYRPTGKSDETGILAEANADISDEDGCDCGYSAKKTGLARSMGKFRGGHFETVITHSGDADIMPSVWFQSSHVELSALNIHGGKLWSTGYIFNETHIVSSHSMSVDYTPVTGDVLGFTWKKNDDLDVYVNKQLMYTLSGSNWNPDGMYQGYWGEEAHIHFDLQPHKDVADVASTANADLNIEYFRVWQLDCINALHGNVNHRPTSNRDMIGILGAKGDFCQVEPYVSMCEDMGEQRLCINAHPGYASGLTQLNDVTSNNVPLCEGINDARLCGGGNDFTGHRGEGDFNAFRGSVGQCIWDYTGNEDAPLVDVLTRENYKGKCVGRAPPDSILAKISESKECGGSEDRTKGHGMWCLGQCVRKTLINQGVNRFGQFRCNQALDENDEDICMSFGKESFEFEVGFGGNPNLNVNRTHCLEVRDKGAGYLRKEHCFVKKFDGRTAPWSPFPNGTRYPGRYCVGRTHHEIKPGRGGIRPLEFATEVQCKHAGHIWGCFTKEGNPRFQCRPSTYKGFDPDETKCPPPLV